jgi:hypothetical protein
MHGGAPKRVPVEITTAVHKNNYLMRQLLNMHGGSFGVKGVYREKKTDTIVSKPYVFSGGENANDLAQQILERLRAKVGKSYPPSTVLIVNCMTNCLILEDEWRDAIEQVRKAGQVGFREVFLMDMLMSHATTLYSDRQRPRRPKIQKILQ